MSIMEMLSPTATADFFGRVSPAKRNGDVGTQHSGKINSTMDMDMDMDDAFRHAAKGDFCAFQGQKGQLLELVTCVHENTILHIHLTARYQHSVFMDMHLGRKFSHSARSLVLKILANPFRYLPLIVAGILMVTRSKWYASSVSVRFVKNVLGECSDMLWTTNAKGETLLHLAARYGHDDIVRLLLSESREANSVDLEAARPMSLLEMVNKAGDTALHEAAHNNYPRVVKILIDEDPSFSYDPNKDGKTPLYIAAERGNIQVVSQILTYSSASSPVAYQGPDGKTALHAAVHRNCEEITRVLARRLRSLIKEADDSGMTPLHYAAQEGFLLIVAILLQEDKSAAYIGNKKDHNMTALHMAAKHRRANVMWEIMSQCPQSCEQEDNRGRNLLHFVVEGNSKRALIMALSNRFVKLNLVNGEDNQGNRPLDKLPTTINFLSYFDPYFTVFYRPLNKTADRWLVRFWEVKDRRKYGGNDDIDPKRRETGTGGESDTDDIDPKRRETGTGGESDKDDRRRETHLLVATLIATVTFAAAFTMPGGYVTDKGPNQGSPVLIKSAAFKLFVIADITSLILSCFAVSIHFISIFFERRKQILGELTTAINATFYALIMMLVAFCAGLYAVLSPSGSWFATICYVLPIALAYIVVMLTENNINCLGVYKINPIRLD